jgi:large subunit ribosomal protein L3
MEEGRTMKAILGTKIGMTQVFTENGELLPVTVIEAGPCTVVEKRSLQKDGYEGVQLGFGFVKESKLTRPERGQFKARGVQPHRYLRELRGSTDLNVGDTVTVDIFKDGDYVDVTGRSIGKGFAGVIKRWNFRRSFMSHGSKYHRGVGSLQAVGPSRVFPGRKLPGHLGNERVTIKRLRVVGVDPEKNLLLVHGSVPGTRGSLVLVREASR